MATKVKLNLAGIREVKRSPGVTSLVREKGEAVAAAARATATDDYYRDRIEVVMDTHTISGSVCHVHAWANNALAVEALHGTLARALDAGR